MAAQDSSSMWFFAALGAGVAYYFWKKPAAAVVVPALVVDGTGQVLTPAAAVPAVSVGVGYVFGTFGGYEGPQRVRSLGAGGLTCLHHSGTCGDATSVYAPKGTVVENLRDGSTYTLG